MLVIYSLESGLQTEPGKEIMFEKNFEISALLNPLTRLFD